MNPATLQKLNLPCFFLTAFATYQGALRGAPWLGLVVFALLVALFLPATPQKKERLLVALLVAVVGFCVDSALVFFRVYQAREASRWLLPSPLCPEWVLTLWLNFGFMLYIFWRLLSRSVTTAVTVGVVFSFLIYGNAARMGLLVLHQPVLVSLGIIALLWAVLIPLFTRCAVSAFAGGNHVVGKV
jgi:hypothetical protein